MSEVSSFLWLNNIPLHLYTMLCLSLIPFFFFTVCWKDINYEMSIGLQVALKEQRGHRSYLPSSCLCPFTHLSQPGQRSGPHQQGFGSAAVSSPSLSVGFNSSFINPATQPSIKLWLIQGHTTLSQGLQTLSSAIRLHQGLGQKGERRSQRTAFRLLGLEEPVGDPLPVSETLAPDHAMFLLHPAILLSGFSSSLTGCSRSSPSPPAPPQLSHLSFIKNEAQETQKIYGECKLQFQVFYTKVN